MGKKRAGFGFSILRQQFRLYFKLFRHDKKIYFGFTNGGSDLASTWYHLNNDGETTELALEVNMDYYNAIDTSDPDGSSSNTDSPLDCTLAHELTHAAMAANIKNYSTLPRFIREGMADLTPGRDFDKPYTIKAVAGNPTALKTALDVSVTKAANDKPYTYESGYIFLRYIAKQFASIPAFTSSADYYENIAANTVLSALGGNDTVYNDAANVVIYGGDGNDYLYSKYTSRDINGVTLSGGAGNDTLYSKMDKASLSGGTGNDSIYSYSDDATITGGAGNDTISVSKAYRNIIQYAEGDGNDIIYGAGNGDTLKITSGTYRTYKSGDNIVVKIGSSGSITLSGSYVDKVKITGKSSEPLNVVNWNDNTVIGGTAYNDTVYSGGQKVKINGSDGKDYLYLYTGARKTTINGGAGSDTIKSGGQQIKINGGKGNDDIYLFTDAVNNTVNGGAGNDTIKSAGTKTSLNGGAGNDYIHLFSQAANTTVRGGAGDDTIKSYSNSKVTYVYKSGDGNDVIDGFKSTDTLYVTTGKSMSTITSGNDVFILFDNGSVTLRNAAGKSISIKNSSGTISTFSTLFAEDNFAAADNLSAIVAEKFVGEIEFAKPENLTQENLITFAKK